MSGLIIKLLIDVAVNKRFTFTLCAQWSDATNFLNINIDHIKSIGPRAVYSRAIHNPIANVIAVNVCTFSNVIDTTGQEVSLFCCVASRRITLHAASVLF